MSVSGLMSVRDLARKAGADLRKTKRRLKKAHARLEAEGKGPLLVSLSAKGLLFVDVNLLKSTMPGYLGLETPDPCIRAADDVLDLKEMCRQMQDDIGSIRATLTALELSGVPK